MSNYPWIASYPEGMAWELNHSHQPVYQMLADSARHWPDRTALAFMGRNISYAELKRLTECAAAGFRRLGVKPGVHVGLFLPNTPHYIISFFGVLQAGGTVVNYSPLDAARTLEHKIADSQTEVMVTLDLATLYPQMAALLDTTRLSTLVVGSMAEMTADPEAVHDQLSGSGQMAQVAVDDRHRTFAWLLSHNEPMEEPTTEPGAESVAVLQYTGGTTGAPKGAMLTHGNLTAACDQLVQALSTTLTPGEERVLAVLPPFHIYAITVNMLFGLRQGAALHLHPRFDPVAALREISNSRITVFPAVPTMFTALLNHPATADHDLSSLKMCNSGGAPLPLEIQQHFQRLSGCRVKEGWGMTETTATGTFTPQGAEPRAGSCGIPVPGVRLKIAPLDGSDGEMPPGERGELCIAGPNVMRGYWNRPDATAEAMTEDGYFRTGDVAHMDADGYVYIVDRTKDMIICSGYNVYPRNIEEAIYEHPAVEEVSVIGVPDDYRGQSPKAYIKLRQDAEPFTLEELQAFLRSRIGKHEMVHALEFRDALPRTPVGKLSKKELYEEVRAAAAATGTS
ncbi:MAG: long-chain fatty acid--CoA ligase [Ectothiorhodospiraceae bacterium]|nr:long-chain fatty acid--CoA ligase [Ectothiorhodospiraceae bacterium]MCH8505028.1 long-chain fatty acid--CoA ligase [Ectothiorhodospiraceae bacterium]